MDLGSFFGSKNLFTCPLDVSYSEGERSERASAASDVSGAMELQRLGTDRQKQTDIQTQGKTEAQRNRPTAGNSKQIARFPFICQDRFMLGGFFAPRRSQNASKTRWKLKLDFDAILVGSWRVLGAKMGRKTEQNRKKIEAKRHPILDFTF